MNPDTFPAQLRAALRHHGLSQTAFAERCGVSTTTIGKGDAFNGSESG